MRSIFESGTAKDIAKGLYQKPIYLLIFGLASIFMTGASVAFGVGANSGSTSTVIISASIYILSLAICLFVFYQGKEFSEGDAAACGDLEPSVGDVSQKHDPALITDHFDKKLDIDFRNAKDALCIGVHQSHILIRYYETIEAKLAAGHHIRVLLQDPADESSTRMTAMRFPGKVSSNQELARITSSLASWTDLKRRYPELVSVRVIPFLLPYGGFLLNPEDERAAVYIQRYTFKVHGGSRKPKFYYTGADNEWFRLYRDEILGMWAAGNNYHGQ